MIRKLMHDSIDELEEELDVYRHALYAACADLISINYPNNHTDVDGLYDRYLDEAREGNDEL